MYFQENKLYDLYLVTQNEAKYPPQHMAYASVKFEIATSHGSKGYEFRNTRNPYLTLTLEPRSGSHNTLKHVAYTLTKFEVARPNSLERDAFTIKKTLFNL